MLVFINCVMPYSWSVFKTFSSSTVFVLLKQQIAHEVTIMAITSSEVTIPIEMPTAMANVLVLVGAGGK